MSDIQNVCFICDITKREFNNNGISFSKHTTQVHYLWDYAFFIIGLLEKDEDEYNGIETYIAHKYHNSDTDWLPFQQTTLLKNKAVSEEEARDKKIQLIEEKVSEILTHLKLAVKSKPV